MLHPQNGDRIVTIDSVTSRHPARSRAGLWQVFPFGVVFDRRLTIIYVGRTLQKLFDAAETTTATAAGPRAAQARRSSVGQSHDATGYRSHPAARQNVQLIGQPLAHHFPTSSH